MGGTRREGGLGWARPASAYHLETWQPHGGLTSSVGATSPGVASVLNTLGGISTPHSGGRGWLRMWVLKPRRPLAEGGSPGTRRVSSGWLCFPHAGLERSGPLGARTVAGPDRLWTMTHTAHAGAQLHTRVVRGWLFGGGGRDPVAKSTRRPRVWLANREQQSEPAPAFLILPF